MTEPSAAEWVAGLQSGEAAWQGRFFSAHWGSVYPICARILRSAPDANDVATDVLVDFMFKYVDTLSRPEALAGYLRLMAVRRSLRFRQRQTAGQEDAEVEGLVDREGQSPEEAAGLRALMPRLERCLDELTPRSQQVLRLHYAGEMANEKIGAIVGCTKQHVGRIIKQSLQLLRACLERGQVAAVEQAG